MRNYWFFIWKKIESPSPKDALCQVWLKLAQWFWRRGFFNFVNVFSLFHNYLPLEKGRALYLNKLKFPFLILSMNFRYFWIICSWKRVGLFIWTNLNPLHPKMLCTKIGWNWPSGSGRKDFLILSMYFHYFVIISPWKRAGPSFEQTWIPFTQGYFVPSLFEIGSVVLEKKIFKFCQCIFAIS